MLKSLIVWTLLTGASVAGSGEYSAVAKSDAALRAAPDVNATQLGIVPAGTTLSASVCFYEGAYCYVTGANIEGYVAGDLLTISGDTNSVQTAEKARWALMEENRQREAIPEWEADNIVVWGDSLSNNTFGSELGRLLPGRSVSMQGVPGESGQQIAERMLSDTRYDRRFKIIWDRHYTGEKPDDYLREITPMIEKAKATGEFIVLSDIQQLLPSDNIPDPAADAAITSAINQALAKLYPKNFVDVSTVLADLSTRGADGLHLSETGNNRVAEALAASIGSVSSGGHLLSEVP